jgi:hypothetical protein
LIGKIINLETFPVAEAIVSVLPLSEDNTQILPILVEPNPTTIQPGMEALFQLSSPLLTSDTDVQISITGHESDVATPVSVEVGLIEWRLLADGRIRGIGMIENLGDHLLKVQSIDLLLYDGDGQILGVARSENLQATLPPLSKNAFSVSYDGSHKPATWETFIDASPELLPPPSPLILGEDLRRESTHQGGYYYLGQVRNEGVTPWWVVLDIIYSLGDEILGLDTWMSPLPVHPDEIFTFIIDPAQSLDAEMISRLDPDLLEVQVEINPWNTLPTIIEWAPVIVTIEQFEEIGSHLYLRGRITNITDSVLSQSVIILHILDVQGRIRSIGWASQGETLASGDSMDFDMDLLVPQGLDMNLVEFDLRAYGKETGESD